MRVEFLRTVRALRVWWETDDDVIRVRNFVFFIRRPLLWLRVRRYRLAFRRGDEVIEA